jgi:hypothetical protein
LGRDLGSAIDIGPTMARKILKKNGIFMCITSVRSLTPDEIQSPNENNEREEFDIAIKKKFGASMDKNYFKEDPDYADFVTPTYDCYEDDEVSSSNMPDIYDIKEGNDVDTYDQYVGAHVRVPIGDEILSGKVVRRTRELEIDFYDGLIDEYTANVIAENMYAQCDIEGRQYNLMEGIADHKTDWHGIEPADMYIKHGSNRQVRKKTNGWNLCVECRDGTTSWERLVDIRESNSVKVAEYAAAKSFLDAPYFVWWYPNVLKNRS